MSQYDDFLDDSPGLTSTGLAASKFANTPASSVSSSSSNSSSKGTYDELDDPEVPTADQDAKAEPMVLARAKSTGSRGTAEPLTDAYMAWLSSKYSRRFATALDEKLSPDMYAWEASWRPKLSDVADLIAATDPTTSYALHAAAAYGLDVDIVQALLDAGHDPNRVDERGHTYNVRTFMIGSVAPRDNWRPTPVSLATYQGHLDIRQLLLSHGGVDDTFADWEVDTFVAVRRQMSALKLTDEEYTTCISHIDLRLAKLGRQLGAGSFGAVYEVQYPTVGVRRPEFVIKVQHLPNDPRQRDMLIREIAMMNVNDSLMDHEPFVPGTMRGTHLFASFSGFAVHRNSLIVCLLRRRDETLLAYISKAPARPTPDALGVRLPSGIPETVAFKLLGHLTQSLADFHWQKHPLVHGDIKADNVLITYDDAAAGTIRACVLADYGLMRLESTSTGPLIVCRAIAAPEVSVRKFTRASDMFAFGLLVAHLVTGIWPPRALYHLVDDGCLATDTFNREVLEASLKKLDCDADDLAALSKVVPSLYGVSDHFRLLVHHLVRSDPSERATVADVDSFVRHAVPSDQRSSCDTTVVVPADVAILHEPQGTGVAVHATRGLLTGEENAEPLTISAGASVRIQHVSKSGEWVQLHPEEGAKLGILSFLARHCLWIRAAIVDKPDKADT